MSDFTRVRWDMLRAARLKCRKNVIEAERSGDSDRIHTAYKLSSFLGEAFPDAWAAADEKIPDAAAASATESLCLDPEVCNWPNGRCVEPSRCKAPHVEPRP